jgi:hypothetical protein
MASAIPKPRKPRKTAQDTAVDRMEFAGPSGEELRRLVKKHPAPQQWYDEDQTPTSTNLPGMFRPPS